MGEKCPQEIPIRRNHIGSCWLIFSQPSSSYQAENKTREPSTLATTLLLLQSIASGVPKAVATLYRMGSTESKRVVRQAFAAANFLYRRRPRVPGECRKSLKCNRTDVAECQSDHLSPRWPVAYRLSTLQQRFSIWVDSIAGFEREHR